MSKWLSLFLAFAVYSVHAAVPLSRVVGPASVGGIVPNKYIIEIDSPKALGGKRAYTQVSLALLLSYTPVLLTSEFSHTLTYMRACINVVSTSIFTMSSTKKVSSSVSPPL